MGHDLPDYANVTADDLARAGRAAVEECDARIAALVAVPAGQRTFANTVLAVEEARAALKETKQAWGLLADAAPDDDLREAAWEWAERLGKHRVGIDFDEEVHHAVREYAESAEAAALTGEAVLTGEDGRLLGDLLRDYRRSGIELPAAQRKRVRVLLDELVELGSAYEAAIAEWKDGIVVSRDELDGLPESFIDELERVDGGYRVSLDYPESQPFMAEARSARRRRELLEKNLRKGGPENVERVERAIAARREIASILGYSSWAAYVIETRMAKTPEAVAAFLDDLRERAAVKAAADLIELADANEKAGGSREITPWERSYAISRLKQARYAVDEMEIAQYLPLDACLQGLFAVTGSLLGIRYEEVPDASVWHPEVRTFDIYEAGGGQPLGRCYLDLFPRPNKYKHAMQDTVRPGRRLPDGSYQQPVSVLLTNLTRPTADRPSLLRHDELITIFHEFGHVLHDVLARAEHSRYAGAETELDFVEAPSQMLEHWCWEPAVLNSFARHYRTGEPMPAELLAGLIAAKTVASGVLTMESLALTTLDLAYHSAGYEGDSTATVAEVYAQHGLRHIEGTHRQSGWVHLFGYDAAYYGYLWSQVMGDDMYTRFEAAGPLDRDTGAAYRHAVLERGGTVDGELMVRDFLGRDPSNAAFLRGIGLAESTPRELPLPAGEDLQEEQEHVQHVQEDGRGQQWRGGLVGIGAQPLEVEHGEPGEDDQAEHRVSQVGAGDVHEDQHDADHDQHQQRPEARPRERGQVAPGGVAGRAETGDEQRGRPAGWEERFAANRMPNRVAKAAMKATMPTPPDRLRPSQAPSANTAAVTAT
jgi:thimet oligopeptidase